MKPSRGNSRHMCSMKCKNNDFFATQWIKSTSPSVFYRFAIHSWRERISNFFDFPSNFMFSQPQKYFLRESLILIGSLCESEFSNFSPKMILLNPHWYWIKVELITPKVSRSILNKFHQFNKVSFRSIMVPF